jgi:biopolymer transport protein ExbB/TolQ
MTTEVTQPMNQSALIRPEWTPATIALMVLGFVVFWPLGLAMLAYILFGDRLRDFKRDANARADGFFSGLRRSSRRSPFATGTYSTGNVAFDEWRKAELDRMEEERRRMDEMREEFDSYLRELRRAKDQEEFDRFMRERRGHGSGTQYPAT